MQPVANLFDLDFDRRVSMAREHVALQHAYIARTMPNKDPGVFCLAIRKTDTEIETEKATGHSYSRWRQFFGSEAEIQRRLPEILAKYRNRDTYLLCNTVYKPHNGSPRRIDENVRQLRSLWVDVDCYKRGKLAHTVLNELEDSVFGKTLPWPNRVIFSGGIEGGLWLFWDIEPVPYKNRYQMTKDGREAQSPALRWSALQRHFAYSLKEYGADLNAFDTVRVCRLAGTYNSKTDEVAECLTYDAETRYDLAELADEFLPKFDSRPPSGNKRTHNRTAINQFDDGSNPFAPHFERLSDDLRKICEMRGGQITGRKGSEVGREVFLFQYRHFREQAHGDRELALRETIELNATFTEPLPIDEIRDTQTRKGKVYRYGRARLLAMHGVTIQEQRDLKLIVGDEVRLERRRAYFREYQAEKRAEAGVQSRQAQREANLGLIIKALQSEPEASLRRLATLTGLSAATCGRYRQEAKNQLYQEAHSNIVQLTPSSVLEAGEAYAEVATALAIDTSIAVVTPSVNDTWLLILALLFEHLITSGREASLVWLANSRLLSFDGRTLKIGLPHDFAREWVERKLRPDIAKVCRMIGVDIDLFFVVDEY